MAKIERETWDSGPKALGGRTYVELRVRDSRKKVVAYALCENDEEERVASAEFRKDFGGSGR